MQKIFTEKPSPFKYVIQIIYHSCSITFVKEILHLLAYYVLNHIKGKRYVHIAKGVHIRPTVLMRDAERIFIGENSTINHNNILWAGKKNATIRIGSNVITGPNVNMIAFSHGMNSLGPMIDQPYTEEDIVVGDDVWIGAGVTILGGAKIGDGVVIAAGAVVTKELPSYTVCAGIPAKVIKSRKRL